jgi:hypothetical protein
LELLRTSKILFWLSTIYAAILFLVSAACVIGAVAGVPNAADACVGLPIFAVLFAAQIVIARGAIVMTKNPRSTIALWAAVFACVPFVSPLYVVGIPFGIRALVTMKGIGYRDA